MNAEELRLDSLPKMQEFFREKMGPVQIGDRIFDVRDNMSGFVIAVDGNRVDYVIDDGSVYWTKLVDAIRLPLSIDPVNPERGLLGMLKGFKALANPLGKWVIAGDLGNPENFYSNKSESPTEALLRALCEQELMI